MADMKENPIFRNIQYSPKIWGIEFKSLMLCLCILIVSMMALNSLFGIVGGVLAGFGFAGGFYAFSYWNDNRDRVEAAAKKTVIKRILASYTIGGQRIKIR